jgi:hypothetical protein
MLAHGIRGKAKEELLWADIDRPRIRICQLLNRFAAFHDRQLGAIQEADQRFGSVGLL